MQRINDTEDRDGPEKRLRALLVSGLAGDDAAYREFLEELCRHLRAFFRRRLRGLPDEVEDVVQETLIAVHTRRHTFAADQPLTPWVHAIARYKLTDLLRARAVRNRVVEPLDDESVVFGADDGEATYARRDVARLLDRLPSRQRLPIIHTKLEGCSVAEAARATGMSESAVKVGVHRGLKALAAMVKGTR
jgi:RNA polymerase sigma-70 factor (ECF subfamily)